MSASLALGALARPLDSSSRRSLEESLRALLAFQHRLERFPRIPQAPDATPIVSLYAEGRLVGCSASFEGSPGERLSRAFLLALGDQRFGGIVPGQRERLTAQVAYPRDIRRLSLDAAPRVIAPGAHGLALSGADGMPTLLVPEVAREHELDALGLLQALAVKAGIPFERWPRDGLFAFSTERVVARAVQPKLGERAEPIEAAVRFLAGLVASDGSVAFGRDPRTGDNTLSGPMRHGRAAVVLQALATHREGKSAARRARRWLEREIRAGLGNERPDDWPTEPAAVAGTVALAMLAGLDVKEPLAGLARVGDFRRSPWHAAQVLCALGSESPEPLWRACVRSLDDDPRAPWLAMAAAARGDSAVFERVATALAANVREHGSHRGGVGAGTVPELALTAVTVEALGPSRNDALARACRLALAFVEEHQVRGDVLPEATLPERTQGAFPLTPVHGFLRGDVTAHAVLAMQADQG